ncbi:MAG TPA: hypothetical protein PK808_10115 [Polymorphobacter sp.]|nr:hypothetical protein [Polymorphobacter sp.]
MIFNSLTFFVFLAIVIPLYWVLPRQPRLLLILAAGVVFYGFWRFDFLLLLFASITLDFFSALIIDGASSQRRRRLFLTLSVVMNLTLLGFFKYSISSPTASPGWAACSDSKSMNRRGRSSCRSASVSTHSTR